MNIFLIHPNANTIATQLDDKRLFKQHVECNQMLVAGLAEHGFNTSRILNKAGNPYGLSHISHPVTKWVFSNMFWTMKLSLACLHEHSRRFDNPLFEYNMPAMNAIEDMVLANFKPEQPSVFPLCIPEHLREGIFGYSSMSESGEPLPKVIDNLRKAVIGYRYYYATAKYDVNCTWTNATVPQWCLNRSLIKEF